MRFWSKSQGVGTTKIENILLRKCMSDITAARVVLYRVTKKFEKFYEKGGGGIGLRHRLWVWLSLCVQRAAQALLFSFGCFTPLQRISLLSK